MCSLVQNMALTKIQSKLCSFMAHFTKKVPDRWNGVYKTKDHEPAKLVAKEVSELWKIETPADESISHDFTPEEFSSALQLQKTGKTPGPDSISPKLILHAGAALKTWLNKFLSSCMRQ